MTGKSCRLNPSLDACACWSFLATTPWPSQAMPLEAVITSQTPPSTAEVSVSKAQAFGIMESDFSEPR